MRVANVFEYTILTDIFLYLLNPVFVAKASSSKKFNATKIQITNYNNSIKFGELFFRQTIIGKGKIRRINSILLLDRTFVYPKINSEY
jgi:hypothetical protein